MPTPASSGEVGRSAVNRRVASSNLARGAILLPFFQFLALTSFSRKLRTSSARRSNFGYGVPAESWW